MTNQKIGLDEALRLLSTDKLDGSYSVEFSASDRVRAADAIQFGALGIDVPEELIYYTEDCVAEDEDFAGEWMPIESDMAHYKKHLTIQLKVDKDMEEWLSSGGVDLDSLVSELLTGFYRASKTVKNSKD